MADDDDVAAVEVSQSAGAEAGDASEAKPDGDATETEAGYVSADVPRDDTPPQTRSGVRLALVVGTVAVLALAGLVGWLGSRAYQSHQAQQQRNLFVQVGRQAALNLTTISATEAEADVQRILDSSTGSFYDDFQKRAPSFIEVVKQAQSKSEGTVTEAGLESDTKDEGKVLVAVTVKSQNAGAPDQQPRAWRMRLTVQKIGTDDKVSRVEFIP